MCSIALDERSEMPSNLESLERTIAYPDMTPELTEVFSTTVVELEYRIETDVWINDGCPRRSHNRSWSRSASLSLYLPFVYGHRFADGRIRLRSEVIAQYHQSEADRGHEREEERLVQPGED